tara:strand:+ start:623 stop:1018 length:396 start_codon:yes stop_codon:yes gene_type:complete
MEHINKIIKEVPNGFDRPVIKKEITSEEINNFFKEEDIEKEKRILSGRVYQKNKKLKSFETFFKLLEEEVSKIESKNNKDLDNSFFNLNKKILSSNLYNIKEIINLYDIDEDRIIYFLIGTLIQSIYDKKD